MQQSIDKSKGKGVRIDAPRSVLAAFPREIARHETDILVIGGGVTGLMAALHAAERGARVTLLSREDLLVSNSAWAQGGVAAALDADDSPAFHLEDTLTAGAGLSDRTAVETLAWEAPRLMRLLANLGVPFERENGRFVLGLEGNHSRRRILHVGDATGWALTRTLVQYVRENPRIRVCEGFQVVDLTDRAGRCTGALAMEPHQRGALHHFTAAATILATGGAGALYGITSNQPGALGEGIAMAYRAGAEVCDMEFVQFHPTVLRTGSGQGFLISEATRGEGATLRTPGGTRFMPAYDPRAELAPRDIVTRGIYDAMRREATDHVLLDLTHHPAAYLKQRFPTIYARCLAEGIDPATDPIPVAPAAHYLMGGIRTDINGATSVDGLYAAGECACTGVHGANRLASNSLLECLVFGRRCADAAVEQQMGTGRTAGPTNGTPFAPYLDTAPLSFPVVPLTYHTPPAAPPDWRSSLAALMSKGAGPLRSADRLTEALHRLEAFPMQGFAPDSETITAANAALAARLIVAHSLAREESRGAHSRGDFPRTEEAWQVHLVSGRGATPYPVATVTEMERPQPVPNAQPGYQLPVWGDWCLLPIPLPRNSAPAEVYPLP